MLLAVRAMTYLCDAMPRLADAVVRHGALPVLCQRLLAIEYLDVAEQCLQALEKISRKQPLPCLQAGTIAAVLAYIDFFSTSIQRVAVSIVAIVCKKLPLDSSSLVMDNVPTLCNLLQCEDIKLVETVATCLVRIVDSFCSSPELLDELCQHGIVQKCVHLITVDGRTILSQTTCSSLIGLLTKLASSSLVAVKTLFELNIGSILKGILMASDLSHGGPYPILEDVQSNQVHEVLKLANQLIPPVARDSEGTQVELAKEKILTDQPNLLHQFSADILPASVKVVNSGANAYVCYGCVSIINNIFYFNTPEMLRDLLKDTEISSFLAGLLARKDHHVLFLTLRIVDTLMQKIPGVFLSSFIKEGVIYAIDTLSMQEKYPQTISEQYNDMQRSERCLCYAFGLCKFPSSERRTCRLNRETLFTLAKHLKTTYFTHEKVSSERVLTEVLQKLKTSCAVLNGTVDEHLKNNSCSQNEEFLSHTLDQLMRELCGGETMTTFEFVESGIVKSLVNYLSSGKYLHGDQSDCNSSDHFPAVLERIQNFAHICLSKMDQGWQDMVLTLLVRKLHAALSSFENFPVILSYAFKPRNTITDIPVRRSTMNPCIRVQFVKEENEAGLSNYDNIVSVEISSSLIAIEEYLWPRVSTNMDKVQAISAEKDISPGNEEELSQESSVSSISEGLRNQERCSSSAESPLGQMASQVEPRTSSATLSNQGVQPKLVFGLQGKELDRSVTLYEAILTNQVNKEPDVILGPKFWEEVHIVNYRSAIEPEISDCKPSDGGSFSSLNGDEHGFSWEKLSFFSSLLLAELPCKLDKSAHSYDILLMLKTLEGLNHYSFHLLCNHKINAFAEGRIKSFDELKLMISSVPQSEFVSSKLTDKLEQQMRDPLTSSSGSMPSWCGQLMSTCSFLFSFEAKRKYFRLNTLDSLRTKLNLNRIDTDTVNERWVNPVSHTRRKFKVNRSNILESATKMMESHAQSRTSLEVEFNEEVGTGLGPTMEFYTLISHEFQKVGLGMWREDLSPTTGNGAVVGCGFVVAPFGLFPRPWSAAISGSESVHFQDVIKRFSLLGQIVAKAIKDGRILDIPFSRAFYKIILEQELSIYDIQSFDPELGRTLIEFQALIRRRRILESVSKENYNGPSDLCYRDNTRIEDLCIDFTLPGYSDYVLASESSSKVVNITNLEEYVALAVDATIRSGIYRQVEAFKSGFNEVLPVKALQIFSEDELDRLICGEQQDTWDFPHLVDHMKFDHGYTASSSHVIYLLEIMQEFERDQRRAFLQFVTGTPRLPPGGIASLNPKLTVVRKLGSNDADLDLPSVMTCANYLKLPPYSSKERMRQRLLYAITEGQGSFFLS
uniref:HECT-type E3 ubiquitin transferase n=1 Tax=Ananas comosus var. bracteatus TaxID=296719 RepID=A0A6V7NG42_ANACO|nr:unnamed protein product [Ananas comosus var. bracteatus]